MAKWGRNDQSVTANSTTTVESSNGAPIGTWSLVKAGGETVRVDGANAHFGNTSAGTRASVDVNMFGNTTMGAFIPGKAVGVFGVGANAGGAAAIETNVPTGGLATAVVVSKGTGYAANAAVTLTVTNGGTSGVVNAHANSTTQAGKIDSLLISTAGSGYITAPTVAIAAPAAISINANTAGVVAAQNFIKVSTANSIWQSGDHLYYGVAAGNTAIAGLTGNSYYYVSFANTTGIVLAATQGGANVVLTEARVTASETGHTIQGDTATGAVTVGGVYSKGIAHAGWVLRTEGSGGRAGRVQFETLVAMGSLGAQTAAYGTPALVADASDDTIVPNA